MQTLRKKLVPALITSLCTILLPLSGCKIVPNDQRAKADGSSANQTAEGFNAAGYVDGVWASKLAPHFDNEAINFNFPVLPSLTTYSGCSFINLADSRENPFL